MVRLVRVCTVFRDADGARCGHGRAVSEVPAVNVVVLHMQPDDDCALLVLYGQSDRDSEADLQKQLDNRRHFQPEGNEDDQGNLLE